MARTVLPVNVPTLQAGLVITAGTGTAGTADGHEFPWAHDVSLKLENTSGAATRTVTIPDVKTTTKGTGFDSLIYVLAIGETRIIPPIEPGPFVSTSRSVIIDFESVESDVLVTAIKLKTA